VFRKLKFQKLKTAFKNTRFETMIKVFEALVAKVNFNIVLDNKKIAY
jgi:hypothetical protein